MLKTLYVGLQLVSFDFDALKFTFVICPMWHVLSFLFVITLSIDIAQNVSKSSKTTWSVT